MLRGTETDEELMAHYQEGSEEAFRVLYARHSGKIFGYLTSRTGSPQEATDLLQEVFIKIHRSKHLYNCSLPLLPWIFSVTHSVLIDGRRNHGRKKEIFGYDVEQLPFEQREETHLASITPLMGRLPQNQSVAIQMRYLDEKTFEEIAETLKTSPLNVRKIISRGIQNIKRLIKEGEMP
ncbi:MAG: RNA polymerase sigma factor [Bdellovibrionales bacterium]